MSAHDDLREYLDKMQQDRERAEAEERANSLDGVPWHEARIPRLLHRCKAQTRGYLGFDLVERCACGSIRNRSMSSRWLERNARWKSDRDKWVREKIAK